MAKRDLADRMRKLAQWFAQHPRVPPLSPQTAIELCRVLEGIQAELPRATGHVREALSRYAEALKEVGLFTAVHQGSVIGAVARLVRRGR